MHGPKDARDEVRARQLMFIIDVISYIKLREVLTDGDVGRMEDLLHSFLPVLGWRQPEVHDPSSQGPAGLVA